MKPLSTQQSIPARPTWGDRGATLGLFVVGTAVCGALLAGLLFFFNDRFRARTLSVVQDIQRWTPDDIRQDPFRYLISVADRTESIQERLSEEKSSLDVLNDQYQTVLDDADSNLAVVARPLEELKELYRSAEATGKWPEAIYGVVRDRDWVRNQIVLLHQQKVEQLARIVAVNSKVNPWEAQLSLVENALSNCERQLTRIESVRMILKDGAVSDKLLPQLVKMEQVIDAAHATLLAIQGEDEPEWDARGEDMEAVDELAFEAILRE